MIAATTADEFTSPVRPQTQRHASIAHANEDASSRGKVILLRVSIRKSERRAEKFLFKRLKRLSNRIMANQ